MPKSEAIVFYFPCRGFGGVSILFLRLAQGLRKDFEVYLADYSDGYMATHMPDGIQLIKVDCEPRFPSGATFVFQAFLPWRFPFANQVSPESRMLFWVLHPKNFDPSIFNANHRLPFIASIAKLANRLAASRKSLLARFVGYLETTHAIVYQDRESIRSTSHLLDYEIDQFNFLPVPLPAVPLRKSERICEELCFAWVGRICDFKYSILEHVVRRLRKIADSFAPVRLFIIGSGDYFQVVRDAAREVEGGGYSIEFLGDMPEADLPAFLVERVDFLFAMGTSALEGARVGVPVFLTDYSYNKIEGNYRFRFLFDNSGYCLAEEISPAHFESESTLEATIEAALANYSDVSCSSYRYWEENFSLDSVAKEFLKHLQDTRATFGQVTSEGYFRPDFWGRIFRGTALLIRPALARENIGFRQDC